MRRFRGVWLLGGRVKRMKTCPTCGREIPGLLEDRLLKRPEAAELLGLKPQTLAKWAVTGANLPFVKVGTHSVRYRLSDICSYIERL